MNQQTRPDADTPAIGVSFQHQLDDHRSIVFQGFVERDCSDHELDRVLDKLRRASDRQKMLAALPSYRIMLANRKQGLKQEMATHLDLATEASVQMDRWRADWEGRGARGEFKLQGGQKGEMDRLNAAMAGSKQKITLLEKEIADLEAQIGEAEIKTREGVEA